MLCLVCERYSGKRAPYANPGRGRVSACLNEFRLNLQQHTDTSTDVGDDGRLRYVCSYLITATEDHVDIIADHYGAIKWLCWKTGTKKNS